MTETVKIIGQRIRNYRVKAGLSQEKLAEISGCHQTYIGQIERAEKNATLESIEKISSALNIPLSKLFEKIGNTKDNSENIPLECYEFISSKTKSEQKSLFNLLIEIDKYKNK